MRCTVFGTGYLGATHAAGMAELGHEVVGVDIDPGKIAKLASGDIPFYEPGLRKVLRDNIEAGRLRFTTDYDDAAEFGSRIRDLTAGAGVAAVFDGVGASTFDASLASLAVRGTLALFGASSGPVPAVDPQRLNAAGSVYLTRPTLVHFTRTGEEFAWRSGELFAAIADGSLSVTVSRSYPLAEAAQAHRDLQGRQTVGSIVLTP